MKNCHPDGMAVLYLSLLAHAAGAVVVVSPVAAGQSVIGNRAAGVGGVDKLTVAHIDACVGQAATICIGEEYHIAGLQVGFGNIGALLVLIHQHAVRGVTQSLQHIVNETGAVKTARGCTAIDIGGAQILFGLVGDILTAGNGGGTGIAGNGAAVEGGGAGRNTQRLAHTEELGGIGRLLVLVRIFCLQFGAESTRVN